MSASFDPYHKWLGIAPHDQPPHHYCLLGIPLFEADVEVIEAAATRRGEFLQSVHGGPQARAARRLMGELDAARNCLLQSAAKATYDQQLAAELAAAAEQSPPAPPPPPRAALSGLPISIQTDHAAAQPASKRFPAARPAPSAWKQPLTFVTAAAVGAALLLAAVLFISRGKVDRGSPPAAGAADAPGAAADGSQLPDRAAAAAVEVETANQAAATAVAGTAAAPASLSPQPATGPPAQDDRSSPRNSTTTPAAGEAALAAQQPSRSPADAAPPATAAPPSVVPLAAPPTTRASTDKPFTGALQRDVWHHCDGRTVEDLWEHVEQHPQPDERVEISQFATPEDIADQYGQRLSGYLHPPLTGKYTFQIRANATACLLISSDENFDNIREVENNDSLELETGRVYYLEGWHKESTGRDYFSVAWRLPDGSAEDPIPGTRLSVEPRWIARHEKQFVVAQPTQAVGTGTSLLDIHDDGLIRATGPHGEADTYFITLDVDLPTITALRLVARPHDGLPAGGPGRAPGGRFSLAEVRLLRLPADPDVASLPLPVVSVTSHAPGPVERIADGNEQTRWSVRRPGQATAATLVFEQPLELEEGMRLAVEIVNRDSLGCFRLWVTSAPDPAALPWPDPTDGLPNGEAQDGFQLLVNLGGGVHVDPQGRQWIASRAFDQTTFGHEGGRGVEAEAVDNPLAATAMRGIQAFRAVVPNGSYEVVLYFCEHWSRDPRRRMFSVAAEGRVVLANFSPLAAGGGTGQPYAHRLPTVTVRDGRLDLDFQPSGSGSLTVLNAVSIRQLR